MGITDLSINSNNLLYVSNFYNKTISVVNSTNNTIVDTLKLHFEPMKLEIDTTNNILYVLSEDGGGSFLSLIDLTNLNKTFDILLNSETSAIEVFNDRLYLADSFLQLV